jgi:hypothetical protein
MAEFRQFLGIALTADDRSHDRLSGHPAQITNDVCQLQVHLRECFLHSLDAGRCSRHVFGPLPPVGAKNPNLRGWLERVIQQPVGVQLQQPLTLLHVALAPWKILGVPCIDEVDLKAMFFQNFVERNPIDSGRPHGHRLYSTSF